MKAFFCFFFFVLGFAGGIGSAVFLTAIRQDLDRAAAQSAAESFVPPAPPAPTPPVATVPEANPAPPQPEPEAAPTPAPAKKKKKSHEQ
jgi:hypothetical protein